MKLEISWKAKDTVNKTNLQPTDWEKIFTNPTSDKVLILKIYKELKKLSTKKTKQKMGDRTKHNSQEGILSGLEALK